MKSLHPAGLVGLELLLVRAGCLEALDPVGLGHRADQEVRQVLDLDRQGHRVEHAQGACLEVGLVRQVARLARQVVHLALVDCPAEDLDRLAERGLVGPRFLRGARGAGNDAAALLPMMKLNTKMKKKSLCVQATGLGVGLVYRLVQVACPVVERAREACLGVGQDRQVARLARQVVRLALVDCPAEGPDHLVVRVACQARVLDRPVVQEACLVRVPDCPVALAGYQVEGHVLVDCLAVAHVPVGLAMKMKMKKRDRCAQAACRLVAHVPVECPVRAPGHQHDQVDYPVHLVARVLAGCLELGLDRLAVPAAYLVQGPERRHVRVGYLVRGPDRPHVLVAYQVLNPVHPLDQAGCQAQGLVLQHDQVACQAQDLGHRHDPAQRQVQGPERQHAPVACPARGLDRPLAQGGYLEPSPARQHAPVACLVRRRVACLVPSLVLRHDRVACRVQVPGRLLDRVDSPAWQGALVHQVVRLA